MEGVSTNLEERSEEETLLARGLQWKGRERRCKGMMAAQVRGGSGQGAAKSGVRKNGARLNRCSLYLRPPKKKHMPVQGAQPGQGMAVGAEQRGRAGSGPHEHQPVGPLFAYPLCHAGGNT